MPIELQSELTSLRRDLLTMGAMVERRLTRVIDALVNQDLDAAHEVRGGDDEIDRMETMIEEHAMRLLALAHPVAGDLRLVLAVMRINTDFERMADMARGISKRILRLAEIEHDELPSDLIDIAFAARTMLTDVLVALGNEDATLGRHVRSSDRRVDDIHKAILLWARQQMPAHPEWVEADLEIMAMAQRFERIADLAASVATEVIFLVEGQLSRHAPS
ncbi:MAG: phosphate signaling complex protein PhoU [Phycisphaerae bacterium]|nr:phosphate signaling complex protein PhoU [Phycisphaerae bacterium]